MVRRLPAPDEPSSIGVVVLVGVLLVLLFPYFESTRNANERPRLLQGIALVEDDAWSIDATARRLRLDPGPDTARSTADEHLYPNKPPGTSLVAAAAYRVAKANAGDEPLTLRTYTWWARLFGGWAPTVLLCLVLARRWAIGAGAVAAAVLMYALGTPAAAYAHLLYGHQLAAMGLAIGIPLVLDAARDGDPDAPSRSASRRVVLAAIGGLCAGGAVLVEYAAAFAAVPLAVALAWALVRSPAASRRTKAVVIAVAVVAACIPVAYLMRYHALAFGSPWTTGYHHAANPEFAAKHAQGLLGLATPTWSATTTHLFAPDAGLLWWVPLLPLAIYGLVRLAIAGPHRTEARVQLALVLIYLLITVSLSFEGGWRVGPRYVVLVLPSLVLGWAWAFGELRDRAPWLGLVVALGTYAIVVNQLAANLWPHIDPTNINHAVSEVLLPLWEADARPYGLLRDVFSFDALWVVIAVAVLAWLSSMARVVQAGWRTGLAITGGAILGLVAVAATRYWPAHPKSERNLAYILTQWEPRRDAVDPPTSAVVWAPSMDRDRAR